MGFAYAASGWALLQVFGFAADAFHWPDGAKQFAMLVLAVGLPVAVTLAWFHGDRGEQRVTRTEVAILALILGVGARRDAGWSPNAAPPMSTAGPAATAGAAPDGGGRALRTCVRPSPCCRSWT